MFVAPRGTVDILPEDQPYWQHIYREIRRVAHLFGFERIDTPIIEDTSLFQRGVGEGTDVVDKEMYSFQDRGGREITLRPEFTAGVMRAYLQHGMKTLPQPVKLYTTGPLFRYERVQAGRYRQHTQFDIECIGSEDPAVDLTVMSVAWQLFKNLGFKELSFQLNSTGCPACRPAYLEKLVDYYREHVDELCDDCKRRLQRNPLRLLDCKQASCQPLIAGAPHIQDHLCTECADHFATLRGYLDALGKPYSVNHRLVRGLDYYTKTVFEVWAAGIGAQNAVCGGGRYDGLAEQLDGPHIPGIGFGSGIERLVLTMKEQGIEVPGIEQQQVALIYRGTAAKQKVVQLAEMLRDRGISASFQYGDRSIKAQLRAANRAGAQLAVVLGDQELESGEVPIRDMRGESPEATVALDVLVAEIAQRLEVVQ